MNLHGLGFDCSMEPSALATWSCKQRMLKPLVPLPDRQMAGAASGQKHTESCFSKMAVSRQSIADFELAHHNEACAIGE